MPPWIAILPVKGLDSAKSRLADAWASPDVLALAFVEDSLRALAGAGEVDEILVASADPLVAAVAARWGATVIDDSECTGINEAAALAAAQRPQADAFLVMVSDLPAVDAPSIGAVLRLAASHPTSFLPDAAGAGTTMWCTTEPKGLRTQFGTGSARAHAAGGAADLSRVASDPNVLLRARQDVDTAADLAAAIALGVGPATEALLPAVPSRP